MDRRDALKALTLLASSTGLTMTPVTTVEASGIELVLLKPTRPLSQMQQAFLRDAWTEGIKGTALERTRMVVLDPHIDLEFVRTRAVKADDVARR